MWSRMRHGPKGRMSRQAPRIKHCPVPNCNWQVPTLTRKPQAALKEHLITQHKETSPTDYMTPEFCTTHSFHICRQCDTPSAIYTTPGHLKQHITTKHSRKKTNIDLVTTTYRNLSPQAETHWKESLAWLLQLQPQPPPFRRSTWHKLKHPMRRELFVVYNTVVSWVLDSTPEIHPSVLRDDQSPAWNNDSTPFWKLLVLLEPLLLAPIAGTVHKTHSDALRTRVSLFKTGRIKELHEITWNPQPLPDNRSNKKQKQRVLRQQHQHTTQLPANRLKSAQHAADVGNYSTAYKRLMSHMPTAKLTPPRIARIQEELFPKRRNPPPTTRATGNQRLPPPASQHLQLTKDLFEISLRQMKPGTASGPYATCTDAIVSMALHKTANTPDATRPYFGNIMALTQLIVTGQIPPPIQTVLAGNYFLALHKDLANLEKLRPIGIGIALRRLAAKTALVHMTDAIRPILLKGGQYGIQTPGGVDFVAQTTTAAVHQYIHCDREENLPTRSLLLLDLHNMFNNTSRTAARAILLNDPATAPLVPLYDLLTGKPCQSWFFDADKNPSQFLQEEGFPQGCPLSPLFACLLLLALTNKINKEQAARAAVRKTNGDDYDDGKGGVAHTASIMDDTSICLPHQDIDWFLQRFQQLGEPMGIQLNVTKTKILTSTSHESPLERLQPQHRSSLQHALHLLSPNDPKAAELTTGTRFLGQPIGSPTFAQTFIEQRLHNMESNLDKLNQMDDLQTRSSLFRYSFIPAILHLLPADIVQANPCPNQRSTLWNSPVTTKTNRLIAKFISNLTSTVETNVTEQSTLIASLPNRLGGLGYHNAAAAAYPRLLTQTARALKLAQSKESPIPTHHQQQYRNWEHSEDPAIIAFRRGLSLFTHEYADQTLYKHERYDHTTHNRQINHILQEHVIPKLIETTTPTERVLLPSLLSPLTSMAFHLPRPAERLRLDNQIFRTAIRRKLRLPLFHSDAGGRCRCNKELDKEGDHLFHCNQASKTALLNAVRDTLFDILRRAAPAAKTVDSLHDVHIEPLGLVPLHNRNIRPADVGLHLTQPHNNEPFQYVAIHVTIPPPQSRTPLQEPSDHTAIAKLASRTHNEVARAKYCRDPNTATHLLHNGIYLIPFTVDHLGSMGHFATRLLFNQDHPLPFSTAEPPDWKDPHFGKSTT